MKYVRTIHEPPNNMQLTIAKAVQLATPSLASCAIAADLQRAGRVSRGLKILYLAMSAFFLLIVLLFFTPLWETSDGRQNVTSCMEVPLRANRSEVEAIMGSDYTEFSDPVTLQYESRDRYSSCRIWFEFDSAIGRDPQLAEKFCNDGVVYKCLS